MQWLNQSLFRRLLISFLTVFLLGFAIIGTVISLSTKDYITNHKKHEMLQQARSVNATILHSETVTPEITQTIEKLGQFSATNIWLINMTGEIVATSSKQEVFVGELINDHLMKDIKEGKHRIQMMEIEEEERPMLSVIVPWGTQDKIHGGIILHSPISGITSTVRNIREIVLWAILGGVVIVAILVSYLSWSISKPLKRIEEAANEIAFGNYNKKVQHNAPDEIGELVKSFNRMAEKLYHIEKERGTLEQRRNDFIANISHELRTPLTAMKGFLEALQDGLVKDSESQKKYYDIMYQETEYLNHLVNDLMDVIKLENREIRLDLYFVQIEEVVKKVALHLNPFITERGNKIIIDESNLPLPKMIGDSFRLEQIFKNMIDNANKFTNNGTISISFQTSKQHLIVQISDNGIGIPSHDLKRIWDRFFKVDRVRNKKGRGRGTGLGLSIVKEIVNLHNGQIEATSILGEGTTFTLYFPYNN